MELQFKWLRVDPRQTTTKINAHFHKLTDMRVNNFRESHE
jgi:hypothetical protein